MTVMDLVDRLNRQAGETCERMEDWLERTLSAIPVQKMRTIALLLLSVPLGLSIYALLVQGGLGLVVLLILDVAVILVVTITLHNLERRLGTGGKDNMNP